MEIVNEPIGKEASVKVELTAGKIVVSGQLGTSGVDGSVNFIVDGDYFFDLLASKIPGQIDDAVIAFIKSAIKAL